MAIDVNGGLDGLNVGFQPRRRATDLGFAQQRWAELMRMRGEPVEILLLDVEKAYDSVSWSLLELSLRRFDAPAKMVDLIRALHTDRQTYVCTAFGQPVPFMQRCGLAQGDSLSPVAWLLVYDAMLAATNREYQTHTIHGGIQISAAAMADDLSLTARERGPLQSVADYVAGWFAMAGVRVNPTKTEHVSYRYQRAEVRPLTWLGADGSRTEITQRPLASAPVRTLGQQLIADGSVEQMVAATRDFVEEMVQSLSRRRLTDRICQLYGRAVILPVVSYRLLGLPLLQSELQRIEAPYVRWMKHGFGLPSTAPSAVVRHRRGVNLQWLEAVMAARNVELTMRMLNGQGRWEFRALGHALMEETERVMKFPGPPLEFAALVSSSRARSRPGIGRPWLGVMARSLQWYDLGVQKPEGPEDGGQHALQAFRRIEDDSIITGLADKGMRAMSQVFWLGHGGQVHVHRPGEGSASGNQVPRRPPRDTSRRRPQRARMARWLKAIADGVLQAAEAERRAAERGEEQGIPPEDPPWVDLAAIRAVLSPAQPTEEQFSPQKLAMWLHPPGTRWDWDGVRSVVAYTDGSVVRGEMGFGVYMRVELTNAWGDHVHEGDFRGRCTDNPNSSTMAELMAIAAVLAIVPANLPVQVDIHTDSQAAIAALMTMWSGPQGEWQGAPALAPLMEWMVAWHGGRGEQFRLHWVKAHAGNQLNERADQLAQTAHEEHVKKWTLQLGPPPQQPYRLAWERRWLALKPNTAVRMVEESWTEERLLQQVRTAHPEFSVCKPELDAMMRALSWYHGGDGRYAPKRSFGRTSDHDSTERSLGLKLLLGTLPVMQRQTAWYPEAYPEPAMRTCPKGHVGDAPVETREHFLECSIGDARPIRPRGQGRADLWMWDYIAERRSYMGITTGDSIAAERALRPGVGEDDENPPPTAGGRRLTQRAYRLRLSWALACWKNRNDRQIEREETMGMAPQRRRRLMKKQLAPEPLLGPAGAGGPTLDDGVPRWRSARSTGTRDIMTWARSFWASHAECGRRASSRVYV